MSFITFYDFEPRTRRPAKKKSGRGALHRRAMARKKIERLHDRQRLRHDITEVW